MMKSTGIIRKADELGRLVLPKELRSVLGINYKDGLEIFTEDDSIILRKYHPNCFLCGQQDSKVFFKGKRICRDCIDEIKKLNR